MLYVCYLYCLKLCANVGFHDKSVLTGAKLSLLIYTLCVDICVEVCMGSIMSSASSSIDLSSVAHKQRTIISTYDTNCSLT